jgi:hypothetical protein
MLSGAGVLASDRRLCPPAQPASISARARHAAPRIARLRYFIVGMTNSAPSFVPVGQRDVTVLVLV